MDANKTDKEASGSLKIDPKVHKQMTDLCKKKGWVIGVFATEAIKLRVAAVKDQEKNNA